MGEEKKTTAPVSSVGADGAQPNVKNHTEIIANSQKQINLQATQSPEKIGRSGGLQTISMTELYDTVFKPKTPVVDGFLYSGTYLFVGAPKVGKSFFMAQLAYHVAMGLPLWEYPVHKGTVLYLALEDDYARLQRRLSTMFGVESADNLFFATQSKTLNSGLGQELEDFVKGHMGARLIIIDTLQKVREIGGDRYSYSSDYEIVTKLKTFSDLHIDFVPFTTGSKRGLETRVSLKQALAALGFKGGTRSDTEWNQWVASEKRQLAAVMERHGIEWEQKGTHEKHLSVLDFEKKERTKEVAALEARKADLQEENAAFEEINENLHEQLQQIDDEIHSLQDDLKQSQQEADRAKKQADKYQKRMNELAPMVNNMERLAAEFSANPEEILPEVAVMESAKSYREKKAKPLVEKMVKILRSVYSAFLDISRKYERLEEAYDREKAGKKRLNERLQEVLDENRELREITTDMERVKAAFGSHQVETAISRVRQQEQIEKEQKQALRRKHNREVR